MFEPKISAGLAEAGCYIVAGQEYKLQHPDAHLQFKIRRGDYDRGIVKLLIIEALRVYGYKSITFVQTQDDRVIQRNSKSFDFFSAKVSY